MRKLLGHIDTLNALADDLQVRPANTQRVEAIEAAVEALKLLDEVDTALATLAIGADHGITPQAQAAINDVWPKVQKLIKG